MQMEAQQQNVNGGMVYGQPVYPGFQQAYPQQGFYQQPVMGQPIGMVPPQQYTVAPPNQFNPMMATYQQNAPLAGAGFVYNQFKPAKFTNPLSNIPARLKDGRANNIKIDQEAIDRAICTHRDEHRFYLQPTHNPEAPNEYRCAICGATFETVDAEPEQIHQLCKEMIDALHTAKTCYINIPENLAVELFQVIAVIEKFEQIWSIAADQYNKYVNPQQLGQIWQDTQSVFSAYDAIASASPLSGLQSINQLMNPGVYGGVSFQQPMMQQMAPVMPQQAPVQQQSIYAGTTQAPINYQAQMMTAQAPGMQSNGFGFTAPQGAMPDPTQYVTANVATQMPTPAAQQPADQSQVPADAPVVTKQLQA